MIFELIRYGICGLCTTGINFFLFLFLRQCQLNLLLSNFISISCAIVFSFFANHFYVFQQKEIHCHQFLMFLGLRLFCMIVEIVCMYIFIHGFHLTDFLSKGLCQILVILLNYVLNKEAIWKQ
ncbi:GtrA family protein [Floccifex sp.]|uniref:GtrA family protein n=1 Tax=Floccifex sp. TaxID=2815810 RepID=UPI003F0FD267